MIRLLREPAMRALLIVAVGAVAALWAATYSAGTHARESDIEACERDNGGRERALLRSLELEGAYEYQESQANDPEVERGWEALAEVERNYQRQLHMAADLIGHREPGTATVHCEKVVDEVGAVPFS